MNKRKLNDSLKKRQERLRKETIKKVESAIKELQQEGFIVSIKLLIERTGLSRSTLNKPHVLEVLKKYKVCRYRNKKIVSYSREKEIEQILKELEKRNYDHQRQIEKLTVQLENKEEKIKRLENELNDRKKECELLRGKLILCEQRIAEKY